MKALLIEDSARLTELIASAMAPAGFTVEAVTCLRDADAVLSVATPDLILLDLGLPDGDGGVWLVEKRSRGLVTPVLVVTARSGLADRVEGLDSGADDYLVKPFATEELLARCRALMRRPRGVLGANLDAGNLGLDVNARAVRVGDRRVSLARRETDLLEVFLRNVETVVSRKALVDHLYNLDQAFTPNALEAVISRLRRKLDEAGATISILTIRGVGYALREKDRRTGGGAAPS